jgi:hypothetical protein
MGCTNSTDIVESNWVDVGFWRDVDAGCDSPMRAYDAMSPLNPAKARLMSQSGG